MTEIITRACGHTVQFTPCGDQYDEARREKLRKKRCRACGLLKNQQDNLYQATHASKTKKIKKGAEMKLLPLETTISLIHKPDGWYAILTANNVTVSTKSAGVMGILKKIARKWLQESGAKLQGKVSE